MPEGIESDLDRPLILWDEQPRQTQYRQFDAQRAPFAGEPRQSFVPEDGRPGRRPGFGGPVEAGSTCIHRHPPNHGLAGPRSPPKRPAADRGTRRPSMGPELFAAMKAAAGSPSITSGHQLRRFFQDVEQRLRAIDPIAFSGANLLHDAKPLQSLNGALRGGEGDAQRLGGALIGCPK